MTDQKHAPVQRHHRLAVLRAQGYTEEWLAERSSHVASRWLEHGPSGDAPGLIGRGDQLAQEMADMEALGRGESTVYREALHRIVDRLDRLIEQEFGVEPKKLQPLPFSKGLVGAINDVYSFHDATEEPCLDSPQWVSERAELLLNLIQEECEEVAHAFAQAGHPDISDRSRLVELANGLADLIYVCVGTALEFGIPLDRVWNEVQRANMAKVGPDGKVRRRKDGKILKPEGWQPPDIEKAVFGPHSHSCEELEAERHQS